MTGIVDEVGCFTESALCGHGLKGVLLQGQGDSVFKDAWDKVVIGIVDEVGRFVQCALRRTSIHDHPRCEMAMVGSALLHYMYEFSSVGCRSSASMCSPFVGYLVLC